MADDKVVPLPPRDPRVAGVPRQSDTQWADLAGGQMASGDFWHIRIERGGRRLMLRTGVPDGEEGKIRWKMALEMSPAEVQGLIINMLVGQQHIENATIQSFAALAMRAGSRQPEPQPAAAEVPDNPQAGGDA